MSNKGIMCIQKSFNGRRHDKRRGDKGDENVGNDDVKMYYCHICNVRVPNNDKCIEDHENGRRHRNKLRVLIPDDVGDDACKQRPRQKRRRTRKKSVHISDYTNLLYDYCEADFEGYCYCRICDLTVLNNAFDVNEHLNSQCHAENVSYDSLNAWRYMDQSPRQPPKRNLMKVPIRLAILGLVIFFTFRYFQSRGR